MQVWFGDSESLNRSQGYGNKKQLNRDLEYNQCNVMVENSIHVHNVCRSSRDRCLTSAGSSTLEHSSLLLVSEPLSCKK